MEPDAKLPLVAWRRDLEYEYLSASYQLTKLMETRLREQELLRALESLVEELKSLPQLSLPQLSLPQLSLPQFGSSGHASGTAPEASPEKLRERRMLIDVAELVISEVESLLRLGMATSQYRERFRFFHQDMERIGTLLGYVR
jgi:hypothetical protein